MKKQNNQTTKLKLNKFNIAKLNINSQSKIIGGLETPSLDGPRQGTTAG